MDTQEIHAYWCPEHDGLFTHGEPSLRNDDRCNQHPGHFIDDYRGPGCRFFPLVEAPNPPERDWETPETKWVQTWMALRPSIMPDYVSYRRPGDGQWDSQEQDYVSRLYGVSKDQMPPRKPVWPKPFGLTEEQVRQAMAVLEKHESEL